MPTSINTTTEEQSRQLMLTNILILDILLEYT